MHPALNTQYKIRLSSFIIRKQEWIKVSLLAGRLSDFSVSITCYERLVLLSLGIGFNNISCQTDTDWRWTVRRKHSCPTAAIGFLLQHSPLRHTLYAHSPTPASPSPPFPAPSLLIPCVRGWEAVVSVAVAAAAAACHESRIAMSSSFSPCSFTTALASWLLLLSAYTHGHTHTRTLSHICSARAHAHARTHTHARPF